MQSNRRTRRDYVREAKEQPFELELSDPVGDKTFVVFRNPNRLPTESAFDLARETDAELPLRALLSDEDYAAWWAEWRHAPVDETNELLEDEMEHYGTSRGKPRR